MTPIQTLKARARGISLGLYAADLGVLRHAAVQAKSWDCDILHFDEMDGGFVPAMIGGPGLVRCVGDGALRDVHLMINNPADHVAAYVNAGADLIVVHAEADGAGQALSLIRDAATHAGRPVLAGLGLMPGTDLQVARNLAPDMVLILSLDPRNGASPDISKACMRLMDMRQSLPDALMAFDGGVTADSIDQIAAARPDMIVTGSAVMKSDNPARAFAGMQRAWQKAHENQ